MFSQECCEIQNNHPKRARGGTRAAATSKMELFGIIVNSFLPLTIITKLSILDVATALDPPLSITTNGCFYTLKSFSRLLLTLPVDTVCKLNVHKTFRRHPGRLLNVFCTFNLRPVSTGLAKLFPIPPNVELQICVNILCS